MPQRDGKNNMTVTMLGNLALSGTTPASSDWFDTREFDMVTLVPVTDVVTDAGTADGFSFVVEESNTTAAADATAVANAQLIGSESDLTVTSDAADDTVAGGIGYRGTKRYVRLTATGTTGTDANVKVLGIGNAAEIQPSTFVGTSVAAT